MSEMTEAEFVDLIGRNGARHVLARLSDMPCAARRKYAAAALRLYRRIDASRLSGAGDPAPQVRDTEAVTVAVLGTASASELMAFAYLPLPGKIPIDEIVAALKPDWVQKVVDHFIEQRPFYIDRFAPLWKAGLCDRPASDALILGYYSIWGSRGLDEESLLGGDVWRFFEVEGGGEFSLANHEKFVKPGRKSWSDRLVGYAGDGRLDRQRLLDASLDALERDFGQYVAGWYSRFHVALGPDADEMTARKDRYLRLLASSVPPTVSFALKHVQALVKRDEIAPGALLAALDGPLQARSKGTVRTALKLVAAAVGRDPALAPGAARAAVSALISEDAGVQGACLDLIETLGVDADVRALLADYVALSQPSVRARIETLAGVGPAPEPAPAEPQVAARVPVVPVASAEEALALYLAVLESPRDPMEVERAVDGLSRFGAELLADPTRLSPVKKRARQILAARGEMAVRTVLALTGRALAETRAIADLRRDGDTAAAEDAVDPFTLQGVHLRRNDEMTARLLKGAALPLLSLPSDSSGCVSVGDLLARVALYRGSGVAPGATDLALALMRLSHSGRDVEFTAGAEEADRAIAHALGQSVAVGPTPDVWAAAWKARDGRQDDARIAALFPKPGSGCGLAAKMSLEVVRETSESGEFHWIAVDVPVSPPPGSRTAAVPALFLARARRHFGLRCCGHTTADIAWASLADPCDPEPFFRAGILQQDTWQKLTDNPTRAFLEPLLRPGPEVGPLGAAILVYYMACEDRSVSALAVDATAGVAAENRLGAARFAAAFRRFLLSDALPTSRWTKALAAVAAAGAGGFVRDAIDTALDFPPERAPRDLGGLLELSYELHVAHGGGPTRPETLACLRGLPGGGKVAKFSKKLLALGA